MHNKQGNNEKRFCTCGSSPSQVGDLNTLAHGESHPSSNTVLEWELLASEQGHQALMFGEKTAAEGESGLCRSG